MESTDGSENGLRKKAVEIPTEHELVNYTKAYMGAYMGIIEKEHPEHLPQLARNAPFAIEVCYLPNACFCMMFQRSNKESIIITDHDWDYVEGKISSGIDYLVTIYAHEGATVADAIKKGKKDAINDIKASDSNEIAQASLHLEKIVDELTDVAMTNRASLKSIASQISKLAPIKESAKRGFPGSDMMKMLQSVKDYPISPLEIKLEIPDRELLERLSVQLSNSADLFERIEAQEELIEELEERINEEYEKLVSKVDEKIDRGLALVLTASDRKIDKGLSGIREASKESGTERDLVESFQRDIDNLKEAMATMKARSSSMLSDKLHESMSNDITEIRSQLAEEKRRIKVIEDYLIKISGVLRRRA